MHFRFLKWGFLNLSLFLLDMQKLFRAQCEGEAGISAPFVSCWEFYKSFSTAITHKDWMQMDFSAGVAKSSASVFCIKSRT